MGVVTLTTMENPARPRILKRDEKIASFKPEYHVRRGRDGKLNAYVCEDRVGGRVILAQKLPELASYCTQLAGSEKDQAVTMASLYQILKVRDGTGRTGGWSKHRWRVRPYDLDREAVPKFEMLRDVYDEAVVIASPHCVNTVPSCA